MGKCYDVTVTGKVQDIGFRSVIEYAGRLLDLSGLVFNANDGSVRILCCGEDAEINDFAREITARGRQKGAKIKDIVRQELPFKIDLPYPFSRVLADDDIDLGRKLDRGNDLLMDIESDTSYIRMDTSALPEIKTGIDSLNAKFDTLNGKFDSFITEQREHNQWMKDYLIDMGEHNKRMDEHNKRMDEHNLRLEKILEKLAGG